MRQRSAAVPTAPRLGDRLVIGYKVTKAILQAAAAVALWVAVRAGFARTLATLAVELADHAVHPLTMRLAHWLGMAFTPAHLHLVALLLGVDALVSAAEGWVLERGYPWGRWLVLVSTGAFLPLEVYEVLHRPRLGRIVVLVINGAIVAFLAGRIRAQRASG